MKINIAIRATLNITSKIFKFTGDTNSMTLNRRLSKAKPNQKGNSLNPTSSQVNLLKKAIILCTFLIFKH